MLYAARPVSNMASLGIEGMETPEMSERGAGFPMAKDFIAIFADRIYHF